MSTQGRIVEFLETWLGASWRTTIIGVCVLSASIVSIVAPGSRASEIATQVATLCAGGGLIIARDNRVSSERAGAR